MKQAPRAWYQWIDRFLISIGFSKSASDANLYVCKQDGKYVVIVLYVDDLIITGDHEKMLQQLRESLSSEFEMTDLGLMHFFLGIEIWQKLGVSFFYATLDLISTLQLVYLVGSQINLERTIGKQGCVC